MAQHQTRHSWISVLLCFYVFAVILRRVSCQERQLFAKVNPGCPPHRCKESEVELVHIRAEGPNDTVHYVWCFSTKPTILTALTSHSTNLSINWENFPHASSVFFEPQPQYSFGVLLNQVFEFNDVGDLGKMNTSNNNASYIHQINVPDSWKKKVFQHSLDSVHLVMDGSWTKNSSFVKEGTMRVELETFRKLDHGPKLPHLLHSSNSTQVEVSFHNVLTKSGFVKNRLALELVIAANESARSRLIPKSFRSLDDERSPGIFSLVDLQTEASQVNKTGGFLQWRPVAYMADERDIVNSTEATLYNVTVVNNSSMLDERTLLQAFFGGNLDSGLLQAVNVSFGAKDDGFYSKNNVSIWTFTVGYGHPPDENFSTLVLIIMGIGLGVPAILIVLSCFYLVLRRVSHRKDDLFLNQ